MTLDIIINLIVGLFNKYMLTDNLYFFTLSSYNVPDISRCSQTLSEVQNMI